MSRVTRVVFVTNNQRGQSVARLQAAITSAGRGVRLTTIQLDGSERGAQRSLTADLIVADVRYMNHGMLGALRCANPNVPIIETDTTHAPTLMQRVRDWLAPK